MRKLHGLISVVVLAGAIGAASMVQAQPDYGGGQTDPAPTYGQDPQQNQRTYEQSQRQYQDAYSSYQDQRDAYDVQHQGYERRRARYERERADYDAQYGRGAFDQYYRDHPEAYDAAFGEGAYRRDFDGPGRADAGPRPYPPGDDDR